MTTRERNNVQCEWLVNPDIGWLERAWLDLEQRSSPSIFLSWLWIGTWLDCFVDNFTVIEARRSGETVGLGILISKPLSLNTSGFGVKHYLHRTGLGDEDQIWIEYNDFLITDEDAEEIRTAMFSSVSYRMGRTDALIIGASSPEKYSKIKEIGLSERKIWETTNYYLELEPLRKSGVTLLKSLSRNSRYQITRSLKKYREIGEIFIEKVTDLEHAMALLELARPFHVARWGEGSHGSGFANPKFIAFHKMLIKRGLGSGVIELNHIKAGDETIGIVYNFRYNNTVYFYFCAMNYMHSSSQYKPGLVTHYLLIEKAIEEGADVYDFMGGTARYKATFANVQGSLAVYQFEHPRPMLSFENHIRRIKQSIQERANNEV